jgi:hypothetical protein
MKLALNHPFAITTLALFAVAVAAKEYDPLKQRCFENSIRCSSLLPISKDMELWRNSNSAVFSSMDRYAKPSQQLRITSCNVLESEIEGLVDAGGCIIEVTAIGTITDGGCLDGVSVFLVSTNNADTLCR